MLSPDFGSFVDKSSGPAALPPWLSGPPQFHLGLVGSRVTELSNAALCFSITTRSVVADMAFSKVEEYLFHLSQLKPLSRSVFCPRLRLTVRSVIRPACLYPPFGCLRLPLMPTSRMYPSNHLAYKIQVPVHSCVDDLFKLLVCCSRCEPCEFVSRKFQSHRLPRPFLSIPGMLDLRFDGSTPESPWYTRLPASGSDGSSPSQRYSVVYRLNS